MPSINSITDPLNCANMSEVRAGVDAVDAEIVKLLGRRFAYMRAAASIKTERAVVRDEARKIQVLDNAEQVAVLQGLPDGFIRDWWDRLVEASIAYELSIWDLRNAT